MLNTVAGTRLGTSFSFSEYKGNGKGKFSVPCQCMEIKSLGHTDQRVINIQIGGLLHLLASAFERNFAMVQCYGFLKQFGDVFT